MRFKAFVLCLSMIASVLTMYPSVAHAQEEKTSSSSCTLSYVDVFCAKNPERCKKSQALASTSVHAEFSVMQPAQRESMLSIIPLASASIPGPIIDGQKLFDLVNSYRASIGLPAFEKHPELCALADSRGPELAGEITTGDIHGGMRRRNTTYWVTENMKYGVSEEEVLQWWLNSPIHASAINGSSRYACTHCTGPVCIMLFTNFVSKGWPVPEFTAPAPTVTPLIMPSLTPADLTVSI